MFCQSNFLGHRAPSLRLVRTVPRPVSRYAPRLGVLSSGVTVGVLLLGRLGDRAHRSVVSSLRQLGVTDVRVWVGGSQTVTALRATEMFLLHVAQCRGVVVVVSPVVGEPGNYDIHKLGGAAVTQAWRLCGEANVFDVGNDRENVDFLGSLQRHADRFTRLGCNGFLLTTLKDNHV